MFLIIILTFVTAKLRVHTKFLKTKIQEITLDTETKIDRKKIYFKLSIPSFNIGTKKLAKTSSQIKLQ